jgi:hypothetical protein
LEGFAGYPYEQYKHINNAISRTAVIIDFKIILSWRETRKICWEAPEKTKYRCALSPITPTTVSVSCKKLDDGGLYRILIEIHTTK